MTGKVTFLGLFTHNQTPIKTTMVNGTLTHPPVHLDTILRKQKIHIKMKILKQRPKSKSNIIFTVSVWVCKKS